MLNDIYGSNSQWLKAEDIQGAKPVVVIETAEIKENTYNGETKKQIVLTFRGKEKQLGLNFTNASRIADLTGTQNHEDWVGQAIKLYVDKTTLADGRTVPCIRIFPELPGEQPANGSVTTASAKEFSAPATATAMAKDDEEIPF
jgi:hypothetical protein